MNFLDQRLPDRFWYRTLAHNLQIGAALCEAFSMGKICGWRPDINSDQRWFPGCGRAVGL